MCVWERGEGGKEAEVVGEGRGRDRTPSKVRKLYKVRSYSVRSYSGDCVYVGGGACF